MPKTSTLRTLLTHHLDISAVPRRAFFELIRHFASDSQEAEKLAEFASEDGPGAVRPTAPTLAVH
jgi:sulfite reductase alpha subunit-like flavoprotein